MDLRAKMTPRWNSLWSRDRVDQCSLTKEAQEVDSLSSVASIDSWHPSQLPPNRSNPERARVGAAVRIY